MKKKDQKKTKLTIKEKVVFKALNPIIEKVIRACYEIQEEYNIFNNWETYQQAVLEKIKNGNNQ